MDKTAKELFEELGYLYKKNEKEINVIECNDAINISLIYSFIFRNKTIKIIPTNINSKDISAINQQIKELGWNG